MSDVPIQPVAEIVSDRVRSRRHGLDWPVRYGQRVYEAITVRRPTTVEIAAFFDRLVETAKTDPDAVLQFPVFYDDEGAPIPDAVLAALDDDDRETVMGDLLDFLPARLRRMTEPAPSSPDAGEATGPTSSMSSAEAALS